MMCPYTIVVLHKAGDSHGSTSLQHNEWRVACRTRRAEHEEGMARDTESWRNDDEMTVHGTEARHGIVRSLDAQISRPSGRDSTLSQIKYRDYLLSHDNRKRF